MTTWTWQQHGVDFEREKVRQPEIPNSWICKMFTIHHSLIKAELSRMVLTSSLYLVGKIFEAMLLVTCSEFPANNNNFEGANLHLGSQWLVVPPKIAILLVSWSGITVNSNNSGYLERDHRKQRYFWSLGAGSPHYQIAMLLVT